MIFCCDLQADTMFQSDKIHPKDKTFNANVALMFIDDYAKFCNSCQKNADHWIKCNKLLSDRFKSAYKKMIDDAYNADPSILKYLITFKGDYNYVIKVKS
jgi:hypothetical protein